METTKVFVETGKKRAFASAADWPGWSRSGRDEDEALQALLEYAPRYARVLRHRKIEFKPPKNVSNFEVVERSEGDATTDFGAPSIPAKAEKEPVEKKELQQLQGILQACWDALDDAAQQAEGKELRKGPRGGGRDLNKILEHVIGSGQGYLRSIAWKPEKKGETSPEEELRQTREEVLNALESAVIEGLPEKGPRGGKIWPARYFVRRLAWHVLDHVWEIEDRIV